MKTLGRITIAFLLLFAVAPQQILADPIFEGPAIEGPVIQWRHSVWGKERAMTAGVEALADLLAARTGGRFTIKIFYGGALSEPKETLDGIKIGAFQSAHFCNFYHPGKNPAFMIFSLPFLPFGGPEESIPIREALYQHPVLVAEMARWNAYAFASTLLPHYEFMGRGKAPETLDDWRGKRVRAGGGLGEAMTILGAQLTTVPASEAYTALQRGTADAIAFPFATGHGAYRIYEVAEWFTADLRPGTSECPVVFNRDAFRSLPQQYRDLLLALKPQVYEAQVAAFDTDDAKYLPRFHEKGLRQITFKPEAIAQFRKTAAEPVWNAWIAHNRNRFDARELLDLVFAMASHSDDGFASESAASPPHSTD